MDRIVCIVGATATGKTALSVRLAQTMDAEIVSFDSMQVYRGMDIGTAKPTEAERGGVRHWMLDVADPCESYSVSRYVEQADACVQSILTRGKAVVLVGGTGLYIDSLIAGRSFAPYPRTGVRGALEAQVRAEGIEPLYAELRRIDPESAASIHPANVKRVIRALEVWRETGTTLSAHNRATQALPPKYRPIWLGLDYADRAVLYERIDRRVDEMFARGLTDEVRRLLASSVPQSATALQAIGYKELLRVLRGETDEDTARTQIRLATRHYAKRQRTWFYRNAEVHWLLRDRLGDDSALFSSARRELAFFDK